LVWEGRVSFHSFRRRDAAVGVEPEFKLAAMAILISAGMVLLSAWVAGPGGGSSSDPAGLFWPVVPGHSFHGGAPPPAGARPPLAPPPPGSAGGTNRTGGGTNPAGGTNTSGGSSNSSGNSSGSTGSGGNGSGNRSGIPGINGTLSVGGTVANVSASFFAAVVQSPNITDPWFWDRLNATPFSTFLFGNGVEGVDQINGLSYASNGTSMPLYRSNDSDFIHFCEVTHCQSIMGVPAEINNTTEAAATVRFVEETLGYHPAYWTIGNEPQGWTHFGIPWTKWQTGDAVTPTPLQYAQLVQRYVAAMRGADPNIRIIGIESADGGSWFDSPWLDAVAALDGPNLTAVAIHPYPDGVGTAGSNLTGFFASLTNATKFPWNYPRLLGSMHAACACDLPIWVGEYNAALAGNFSPFVESYPEVPYLAAGITGALKDGIAQLEYFSLMRNDSGMIYSNGSVAPSYYLYSTLLRNLTLGAVRNVTVLGGPGSSFAVVTSYGNRTSLLVANLNLTDGLRLNVADLLPHNASSVVTWSSWAWGPDLPLPLEHSGGPGAPWLWGVPAEGVLLFNFST
jgi:hypothetical protein